MRLDWQKLKINGSEIEAKVTIKEEGDQKKLRNIFNLWLMLNKAIKSISTRGVNLPEAISENAFCLFFDAVRIVKLKKGKCSFDCIDTITGDRIQIKASSVEYDLTSFGPRSEYDKLYFLDFSKLDGSFMVYEINPDDIYNFKVNKNQTFAQQQEEGKRPRFGIVKGLIQPNKIQPIKVCKL